MNDVEGLLDDAKELLEVSEETLKWSLAIQKPRRVLPLTQSTNAGGGCPVGPGPAA